MCFCKGYTDEENTTEVQQPCLEQVGAHTAVHVDPEHPKHVRWATCPVSSGLNIELTGSSSVGHLWHCVGIKLLGLECLLFSQHLDMPHLSGVFTLFNSTLERQQKCCIFLLSVK